MHSMIAATKHPKMYLCWLRPSLTFPLAFQRSYDVGGCPALERALCLRLQVPLQSVCVVVAVITVSPLRVCSRA